MDHAAIVASLVGGELILFLQHEELGFGIPLSDFQGGSQPNDSSADNSEVKLFRHRCSSLTQSFLAVNLTQRSRGQPVKMLTDTVFTSIEDAEQEVFRRRWKKYTGSDLD